MKKKLQKLNYIKFAKNTHYVYKYYFRGLTLKNDNNLKEFKRFTQLKS